MNLIERVHGRYVHNRRVRILSDHLAKLIPKDARVLDVGCGDGMLAHLITQQRPDIDLRGIDVLVRSLIHIPVDEFDGDVIPFGDMSFDVVMFVDVLHHTDNPLILLREAARVASKAVVIKDHTLNGLFAGSTLRLMDWIGNERYGVALPYNYWPQQRWFEAFQALGLKIGTWEKDLKLYPRPADWIVGRSLHFVARLFMGLFICLWLTSPKKIESVSTINKPFLPRPTYSRKLDRAVNSPSILLTVM